MKIGDKVVRKWKPSFDDGRVMHIFGDKVLVKWYFANKVPVNILEEAKHLKVVNEGG